jgi:hypothetical protein
MKQLKAVLVIALAVLVAAGLPSLAQESKQSEQEEKQKMETPRIKITGTPEHGKVTLTERKRSEGEAPQIAQKPKPPEELREAEAAMKELGMPGEAHAFLEKMLGRWEVKMRYTTAPGAEPMTGRGQASREMVLGGRFLKTTYKGEFMGESFIGMGYDGYDNLKKKYVGTWIDNMSTALNYFEGELDETGRVLTSYGEYVDAMTGKTKKTKMELTIPSLSMHSMVSYDMNDDGEWVKTMEVIFGKL